MTQNEIMTWGAIGFAVFAAAYVMRKPAQPAANVQQQQLDKLWQTSAALYEDISFGTNWGEYRTQLGRMGGLGL